MLADRRPQPAERRGGRGEEGEERRWWEGIGGFMVQMEDGQSRGLKRDGRGRERRKGGDRRQLAGRSPGTLPTPGDAEKLRALIKLLHAEGWNEYQGFK